MKRPAVLQPAEIASKWNKPKHQLDTLGRVTGNTGEPEPSGLDMINLKLNNN